MDLRDRLQESIGATYQIDRELGGGGMSRVFLATETALARRVVIKVLPPELASAVSADRFKREIQLAAQLQHPHIVPVLSAGQAGDVTYYTMPFVEGESLRTAVARSGEMPVGDAVRALRDVAAALSYAHKHGVVHRDIKPDNVLLSDGYAVVTDFGVAKAITTSATGESRGLTSLGIALGTPQYMSPEQAAAEPNVDHRADIYSFGVLAYELLTGTAPFAGRSAAAQLAAHVSERPEPIAKRRPNVPAPLAALVDRCLEKRPADRPQNADDLVRALDSLVTTPTQSVPTGTRSPAWIPRGRRRLVTGAIIAAGALLVTAYFATRTGSSATDEQVTAVFPFRVSAADPSLEYLREGMADLVAMKLGTDSGMRASDLRAVIAAWKREGGENVARERLSQIAARLGAGQLITGEVVGTPARIVVSASLIRVGSGREVRGSAQGAPDSISSLVDNLIAQLLSLRAGEAQEKLGSLTRASLPTLRAYLEGQAAYRQGNFFAAIRGFNRALANDSTFAHALLGRALALAWGGSAAARDSARVRAWRARDRLTPIERLRLEAEAGARLPGYTPASERLVSAERFVAVAPDNAEAWHVLADQYFHFGAERGIPDAMERAMRAWDRALAIDSTFLPAAEHLSQLYHMLRDSTRARRAAERLLAMDSTSERVPARRWYAAVLRGDTIATESVSLNTSRYSLILQTATHEGIGVQSAERLLERAARQALTTPQRRAAAGLRAVWDLNAGRPQGYARADAIARDTNFADIRALMATFWDADSALGAQGAREVRERLRRRDPSWRLGRETAELTSLVTWSAVRGPADSVQAPLARLREIAAMPDTLVSSTNARLTVRTVETLMAAKSGDPGARTALSNLDSLARTVPAGSYYVAVANLVCAKLWEQQGDLRKALEATRRRPFEITGSPAFLSTFLREEGRLAEATGDREGAIRAYTHYLALRHDPEPEWREDARRTRERLERLKRESAGR